jgi:hypothetical protein
MTQPHPPISGRSVPTGFAHGTLEDNRCSFSGTAPPPAARIDIQTDAGEIYSVLCDQTHWTLALNAGDLPTAVIIDATAMDGTLILREGCILASDDRYQPTRQPRRPRGARGSWSTYGPGSGRAWRRRALDRRVRARRDRSRRSA